MVFCALCTPFYLGGYLNWGTHFGPALLLPGSGCFSMFLLGLVSFRFAGVSGVVLLWTMFVSLFSFSSILSNLASGVLNVPMNCLIISSDCWFSSTWTDIVTAVS